MGSGPVVGAEDGLAEVLAGLVSTSGSDGRRVQGSRSGAWTRWRPLPRDWMCQRVRSEVCTRCESVRIWTPWALGVWRCRDVAGDVVGATGEVGEPVVVAVDGTGRDGLECRRMKGTSRCCAWATIIGRVGRGVAAGRRRVGRPAGRRSPERWCADDAAQGGCGTPGGADRGDSLRPGEQQFGDVGVANVEAGQADGDPGLSAGRRPPPHPLSHQFPGRSGVDVQVFHYHGVWPKERGRLSGRVTPAHTVSRGC